MFSNLAWTGNEQLDAQTSHGIAMAVYDGQLIMVYAGEGGENLWMCAMSSLDEPLALQSNVQLQIDGVDPPQSKWRPALATDGNLLHCVYSGAGNSKMYWSWYDGNNWSGNVQLPDLPYASYESQRQPSLIFFNGLLHCVATIPTQNKDSNPPQYAMVHSAYDPTTPLDPGSWSPWTVMGKSQNFAAPAMTAIGNQLILAASQRLVGVGAVSFSPGMPQPINWSPQKLGPVGDDPDVNYPQASDGLCILPWGDDDGVLLLYVGEGGNNLYYAYFAVSDLQPGSLGLPLTGVPYQGNIQIECPDSTPETSAAIGAAYFHGNIVIAYKGESSNNFYIAYAPHKIAISPSWLANRVEPQRKIKIKLTTPVG